MNCNGAIATLEERFDQGESLRQGLQTHLAECDSCRSLCEELEELALSFENLPLESAPNDLSARIRAAVAYERRYRTS